VSAGALCAFLAAGRHGELARDARAPDRLLEIDGPLGASRIEIRNGRARFISSPCRGKVCIHSGWLEHTGELTACLPNRVSIQLLGQHPRFDAVNF
jgi:hypothetical protein